VTTASPLARRVVPHLALAALLSAPVAPRAQTIVPVEQEPVHRVVFENDLVRVIDAALPAGHATLYHTHARDNVPVTVAGGRVATVPFGGEPVESAVTVGQASFAAGGYTHIVRNAGTTPLHFIDVELRASTPAAAAVPQAAAPPSLAGHALALANSRVRVHRVVVTPGRQLEAHRHAGPLLEVVASGDLVAHGVAAPSSTTPGKYYWHGDGAIDAVRNAGRVPYEVVEIEWVQ
jgi:mannose-6-phosphate isomerase-like protein (cupin superfamily)